MKKLAVLSLLFVGAFLQAVLVRLPAAHVLTQRISAVTTPLFIEKTNLVQRLAGQQKPVSTVIMDVDEALSDFHSKIHQKLYPNLDPIRAHVMLMNRSPLIKSILQSYPDAIKKLQDDGVLEK